MKVVEFSGNKKDLAKIMRLKLKKANLETQCKTFKMIFPS